MSETSLNRRQFLHHAGALGLGAVFLPRMGRAAPARSGGDGPVPRPGIVFEKFEAGGLSHYSYFIGDTLSGEAAVIDPRRDVEAYVELARHHRLRITHAIETHVHADFVSGARELAHRTGAEVHASVEGGASYGFPVVPIHHGKVLRVGGVRLRALHTPGHTPEHMSFLASARGSSKDAWGLFTGDFLFVGSVGRPDLMGVENTDRLARQLFDTLQGAFTELPDALPIYPAHGPGSPCGAGIREPEGTPTLGGERRHNPALREDDRKAFLRDLLFSQPPVPTYWPRMKEINARGPKILGELPTPQPRKPEAFAETARNPQTQLLDTRDFFSFGGGHIAGAVNIGHAPSLSMWGGWILDPERPLALVLPEQAEAREVVQWLIRIGIERIETVLEGGMGQWVLAGKPFTSIPQMSVHQLKQALAEDRVRALDVRQPMEWDEKGHLPGARYLFLPEIPDKARTLDRSKPLAVYCGTGYRGSIGASLLKREGFDVRTVPGSLGGWKAAGYEVVYPDKRQRASDTTRP